MHQDSLVSSDEGVRSGDRPLVVRRRDPRDGLVELRHVHSDNLAAFQSPAELAVRANVVLVQTHQTRRWTLLELGSGLLDADLRL